MSDYNFKELKVALNKIGLKKNDTIFCHSNLAFFGKMQNIESKDKLCEIFYETIFDIIGSDGTLVVPTFTYSFSKERNGVRYKDKEDFDSKRTESKMGIFSEWIRLNSKSIRSEDPFYSVSLIGKKKYIIDGISKNSFDDNSVFARLMENNAKFINFNFLGWTFLHYIERLLKVPYRFDKTFNGFIQKGPNKMKTEWTIYVQYLSDPNLSHDLYPFYNYSKENKICKLTKLGKGEMVSFNANSMFEVAKKNFLKNKWFLTKAYLSKKVPKIDTSFVGD